MMEKIHDIYKLNSDMYGCILKFMHIHDIGSMYMAVKKNKMAIKHFKHKLFYDHIKEWFSVGKRCPYCPDLLSKLPGIRCGNIIMKPRFVCHHQFLLTKWNFNKKNEIKSFLNRMNLNKHCHFCFHKIQETSTRTEDDDKKEIRNNKPWISNCIKSLKYMKHYVPQCMECFMRKNSQKLINMIEILKYFKANRDVFEKDSSGVQEPIKTTMHSIGCDLFGKYFKDIDMIKILSRKDGVHHIIPKNNKSRFQLDKLTFKSNVYIAKEVFESNFRDICNSVRYNRQRKEKNFRLLFEDPKISPYVIGLSLIERDLDVVASNLCFGNVSHLLIQKETMDDTSELMVNISMIDSESLLLKSRIHLSEHEMDVLSSNKKNISNYADDISIARCFPSNYIDQQFIRIIQSYADELLYKPYTKNKGKVFEINPCYMYLKLCVKTVSQSDEGSMLPGYVNTTDLMFMVLKYIKFINSSQSINDLYHSIESNLLYMLRFGDKLGLPSWYYKTKCNGKKFKDIKIKKAKKLVKKLATYFDLPCRTSEDPEISNPLKRKRTELDIQRRHKKQNNFFNIPYITLGKFNATDLKNRK